MNAKEEQTLVVLHPLYKIQKPDTWTANKLIGINTVSIGSLSSSIVHPREVFKPAVLANASAIILVHNHLGGENIPVPSNEDQNITQLIKLAGEALQIKLLDHVIISETGYYSFNENGLI